MKITGKVFYSNLKKFTGISSNLQYLQIAKGYKFVTDGYKLMDIYRQDVSGVFNKVPQKTEKCIMEYENLFAICPVRITN